jgi:hypothetical protein
MKPVKRLLRVLPFLVLGGLLTATTLSVGGCSSTPKAKTSNIQQGTMPEGGTFRGVWFSELWGELHMVVDGDVVMGRWQNKPRGTWGKLKGKISGDVLHFQWKEIKIGAVGPEATTEGRGVFKYVPMPPPDVPRLKGQWGYKDNEAGGGVWDCVNQKDVPPRLNSIKGDNDPTMGAGWE